MYVRIVGKLGKSLWAWAYHSINYWTVLSNIWLLLMVDGSFVVVTRPCRSGRQTWRWHVSWTIVGVQYNKMLLQWICPAIRAHNLMKSMVECLEWWMKQEGGRGPDYDGPLPSATASATAWPLIPTIWSAGDLSSGSQACASHFRASSTTNKGWVDW